LKVSITGSIVGQIAELFANGKTGSSDTTKHDREVLLRTFQPKFIQHNSFLI
jgi:hypothetical protein